MNPPKGYAYTHYFEIRDTSGDLVTGWTDNDSRCSLDGANYADCTNEAVEIETSGTGSIVLTAVEMNTGITYYTCEVSNANATTYTAAIRTDNRTVDQEPVPRHRTWVLVNKGSGLEGEDVLQIQASESKTFSFDFSADLGQDDRIESITVVEPQVVTTDLTLTARGVDHAEAKVTIAVVASPTAGEHRIRCRVLTESGDTIEGDGRLTVVA